MSRYPSFVFKVVLADFSIISVLCFLGDLEKTTPFAACLTVLGGTLRSNPC